MTEQQAHQLRRSIKKLKKEGFRRVTILRSIEEIEAATIERTPLWNDRRSETGPFDIIGDVHGCYLELTKLLRELGYGVDEAAHSTKHPEGRRAIFVGDLVDRGPASPDVLRLVMSMVESGAAFCVPGNHDIKLKRKLDGRDVSLTHGLAETMDQLASEPPEFIDRVRTFIDGLISHLVFDGGALVVAHAGMKQAFQGRASGRVRDFALFGETTGETDEFGLPVRYNWAAEYRGDATVVYGHTPVPAAEWVNRTICIDTGCVFGGKLTALRYPEKELVQVPAERMYYEPVKPLIEAKPERPHDLLDIDDVQGKRGVETRLRGRVTIREENAAAALEVISRFAVDPRWLVYLPPTRSPSETCREGEFLEHPKECLEYFAKNGVPQVICEEKHMGSRAIVIVCRSEEAAAKRFGITGEGIGTIYSRTGRRFFDDHQLEAELLDRVRRTAEDTKLFERLESEWLCLDAELMPWSVKAQSLLREQYAPVGAASRSALAQAREALERCAERVPDAPALLERIEARRACADAYSDAYRRYCWPVDSITDLKLAPFHILASEGAVHTENDHRWHMETIAELCRSDPDLLHATAYEILDPSNQDSPARRRTGGRPSRIAAERAWSSNR